MKGFENLTEEPEVPYSWNAVIFSFLPFLSLNNQLFSYWL